MELFLLISDTRSEKFVQTKLQHIYVPTCKLIAFESVPTRIVLLFSTSTKWDKLNLSKHQTVNFIFHQGINHEFTKLIIQKLLFLIRGFFQLKNCVFQRISKCYIFSSLSMFICLHTHVFLDAEEKDYSLSMCFLQHFAKLVVLRGPLGRLYN